MPSSLSRQPLGNVNGFLFFAALATLATALAFGYGAGEKEARVRAEMAAGPAAAAAHDFDDYLKVSRLARTPLFCLSALVLSLTFLQWKRAREGRA